MTHISEKIPAVNYQEWEAWQKLSMTPPDEMFLPLQSSRLTELCNMLSGNLQDNPKKLLLAFLEPEIQKAFHIPGQRELTPDEIAEIRLAIESYPEAPLQYDASESVYLNYLQHWTGISQTSPDMVKAFKDGNNEKVIAHVALAYEHLTEKEAHAVPISDLPSIIAHAIKLYSLELKPWWDFATKDDYSSKNEHDVLKKKSAPLFRDKDCPSIAQFFAKVLPKIMEIREKDPHAALKIFPQSKNVEAFNWRISQDRDGNIIWIFEWYPGAYTPREGEDGHLTVVKNRKLSKEERIVRATIKFDSAGNPIIGLKSQKDPNGDDLPFSFPQNTVNFKDLFLRATVEGNGGGDTIPTNNPFVFLKYLAANPKIQELIEKFEKVHSQFGYADMVVSGMIGPETVFFMDIDIETPKHKSSDESYIQELLQQTMANLPISYNNLYSNIQSAPIVHEYDLQTIAQLEQNLANNLHSLFNTAAAGFTDHFLMTTVVNQLGLSDNNFKCDYWQLSWIKSYLGAVLTRREYEILQSIWQHQEKVDTQQISDDQLRAIKEGMAKVYSNLEKPSMPRIRLSQPGVITPTEMDAVRSARPRHVSPQTLALKVKTVAEL